MFSMYRYYNGEKENPFGIILDKVKIENTAKYPPASMITEYNIPDYLAIRLTWAMRFWYRENLFEKEYNEKDYSIKEWCKNNQDKKEWLKALHPPNKKAMFILWNKQSLTQIADKEEMDFEEINKIYLDFNWLQDYQLKLVI